MNERRDFDSISGSWCISTDPYNYADFDPSKVVRIPDVTAAELAMPLPGMYASTTWSFYSPYLI